MTVNVARSTPHFDLQVFRMSAMIQSHSTALSHSVGNLYTTNSDTWTCSHEFRVLNFRAL